MYILHSKICRKFEVVPQSYSLAEIQKFQQSPCIVFCFSESFTIRSIQHIQRFARLRVHGSSL